MDGLDIPRPRQTAEEDRRTPMSGLPRPGGARAGTGVRTAVFGSQPTQAAQIRSWCQRGIGVPAHQAFPLLLVASELVANAWLHTASGAEGGRVKVQMRSLSGRLVRIAVTDDGPRPTQPVRLPRLSPRTDALAEGGRGLRLVDRLSVRWGWDGELGKPLTVWAHIDLYASLPEDVES